MSQPIPPNTTPSTAALTTSEYQSLLLLLTEIRSDLRHALTRGDDHESRLRAIEKKVFGWSAVAAVLGTGGGATLAKILGA